MLLNENWMKWDNWLFVCCALGDPIIAGLYWISCKLLIVIQFLHQARNQEKWKSANLFLHDFAIFLLSWFRSDYLVWNWKISNFLLYFQMIYKKIITLETLQIFVPCLCFIFIYKKIISFKILQIFSPVFIGPMSDHSLHSLHSH